MRFYLGTHIPGWLGLTDVPLFLSRRRLAFVKRLPRARGPYSIDSGGYSELSMFGKWRTSPEQYVDEVRRFVAEIGPPDFVAIQDWMCEPGIRELTGLTVEGHQARTIESYLTLRNLAPEIPWCAVLQGHSWGDHERHLTLYEHAGVDLRVAPVVGIGSVCRRSGSLRTSLLLRWLAQDGLKMHAFGVKSSGLVNAADVLASADSLAWSYQARRNPPLPECRHARCSSCFRFACEWRSALLAKLERARGPEATAA
jgi:hypothetical protein